MRSRVPLSGVTPRANDSGPENAKAVRNDHADPTESANHGAAVDTPSLPPAAASSDQNQNDNFLFSAVSNLKVLHAALPLRTAFLPFPGHSDPRAMSVLGAQRAQYQASRDQNTNPIHESASSAGAGAASAGTDDNALVRWSTADERALEEAVARARIGLLFVGVNS